MRRYENVAVDKLKPYENNARTHSTEQVEKIAKSIKEFGFINPVLIDGDFGIIAGHGRVMGAKQLGMKEVPCVFIEDLTEDQKKAYIIADNKLALDAGWDYELLSLELGELVDAGFDVSLTGFSLDDEELNRNPLDITAQYDMKTNGALKEKFIMPPFSVLDARKGDWQDRKKIWKSFIDSGKGRDTGLLGGGGLDDLAKRCGMDSVNGTSVFDPVLCEILINWFSPKGGKIIDPFAGGSVRGIVSAVLGREYHGNDLSKGQIKENREQAEAIKGKETVFGTDIKMPTWTIGDSTKIDELITERDFDFMLTCPPYADLEVYSEDPADISNMDYPDFLTAYKTILEKSCNMLAENAFIAIVVGEVRDKKGHYRNFIGDTIEIMKSIGANYYNEIILITAGATLALRAGRQFEATRKVSNTHQKALIFLKSKGDEKALEDFIDSFNKTREITEMKESILIFLKGNSQLAKNEIEQYDFDLF